MKSKFVGGTYDGVELDTDQINKLQCGILTIPTRSGTRQFVLLPPVELRQGVEDGTISREDGFDTVYPYERMSIGPEAKFQASLKGEVEQALADKVH